MNNLRRDLVLYLRSLYENGRSKNTISAYKQDLVAFLKFLEAENIRQWPDQKTDIQAFLKRQETYKKASSSIARLISSLRNFYQWLARNQIQRINPMLEIDAPKIERSQAEILTTQEVKAIIEQIDDSSILGKRDRAIIELLYATGIKVSELTTLKQEYWHQTLSLLKVVPTSGPARIIPVSPLASKALASYLESRQNIQVEEIFLNNRQEKMTRQAVWSLIKQYCSKAKITKKVTPNTWRQTFTLQTMKNGGDWRVIQEILGKTDPNITMPLSQQEIVANYQDNFPDWS
ncbi:MAG: tyrosine-type recombinase/integrase [Lactobacillus sp.]|nr:tyrosine-type recombinase/integrase [Lactobacillus sp.]